VSSHHLEYLLAPQSLAVIGASDQPGRAAPRGSGPRHHLHTRRVYSRPHRRARRAWYARGRGIECGPRGSRRRRRDARCRDAAGGAAPCAAVGLARSLGAKVELFLCDFEQAYVLGRAYDREGIVAARTASEARARRYQSDLRDLAGADDLEITIDAQCESPLYESVVRKVLRSDPDMVIKPIASVDPRKSYAGC